MRRAVVAATLLGIAVTLTGFGGDGDATRERLNDAAEKTLSAGSMTFEATISLGGAFAGGDESIEAHADFESGSGEVVSRFDGYELRLVSDGDTFWLTSDEPEFIEQLPRGKRWVRGTFDELGESDVITPLQPPALLYLLAGATDINRDRAGRTTTYTFDLDLDEAAEDAPRARRQEVRELLYATEGDIAAEGEAVVERGYVRSMIAEGTVHPDDPSIPDVRLRWDATFDDIGDDVAIEPPDDDEVVDLADVPEIQDEFLAAG